MSTARKIYFAFALLAALGWVWLRRSAPDPTTTPTASHAGQVTNGLSAPPLPNVTPSETASRPGELPGEIILRDYASSTTTPEQDLTLMSRLLNNYALLLKSAADRPLSANEEWAAALTGHNPAQEKFLPDTSPALNDKGQLVDRWKHPLWFHALGQRQFEIRSAGPDGRLWTADDLHRNADGSFRRGSALNPASLLETSGGRPAAAAH